MTDPLLVVVCVEDGLSQIQSHEVKLNLAVVGFSFTLINFNMIGIIIDLANHHTCINSSMHVI